VPGPFGGKAATLLAFVIALGVALGAATAGAMGDGDGRNHPECDDEYQHSCPTTTTTKPQVTTTTRPPVTTTTEPTTTTTLTFTPSGEPPPDSGFLAPAAQSVGNSVGHTSIARRVPSVPLAPAPPPPVAIAPTPSPGPGTEGPIGNLLTGPGGVPLSMVLIIAAAAAATMLLVLRGALGRGGASLSPADEGETIGFE